jgi:DMSO/TMAO reductase YedYZ molybdopterin-dependent catalytic subunit
MGAVTDPAPEPESELPPGQRTAETPRVQHYGPVPRFKPETWRLSVVGATADSGEHHLDVERFADLPRTEVRADMHCVTRWTVTGLRWGGVATKTLLELAPPAEDVTHVMAWAEYGYSTNLPLADFAAPDALLATHLDGAPLSAEHGHPLRLVVPHLYAWKGPKWLRMIEYLTAERRGFWEERGYHTVGDPWSEQRWSYQE